MHYAAIQPPFTGKLREMPKKELLRYFEWYLGVLPNRVCELTSAVKQTPGFESWAPDLTPASLDTLGRWFATQVETRNRTREELGRIKEQLNFPMEIPTDELTDRTFSLAMDIGMYLSQVLMKHYPSLKWEQPLGSKRFVDYGQPSLAGFGAVTLNPFRIGHVLAYGLADHTYDGGRLRQVYEVWAGMVQPTS
jgi:hypothetical protein